MMPNNDQILSIIRWLLTAGGPIGALLVARGMSADQVDALTTWLLTGFAIVPPAVSFIWGLFAHTDAAKLAAVNAMPDVTHIIVKTNSSDGTLAAVQNPDMPKVVMTSAPIVAAVAAGTKP